MPRLPRSYIETSYFHVMTQGINKTYIFSKEDDIKFYIREIYKLAEECKIKIISYCIMNNHAHMLLETTRIKNLSSYMQRLNARYAKYYNKKYNRVGYVFRDRYKAEGIYSQRHLYSCIKYIYYNPVKAGICKKVSEYPYSNFKEEIKDDLIDNYEFIDTDEERIVDYQNIIEKFLKENDIDYEELKKDKIKLKELITNLKDKYKVSFRKMETKIGLNRETIRKIYYQ